MGLYQYSIISQTIAVLWRISTLCPCYLGDGKRGKARTNYPKQTSLLVKYGGCIVIACTATCGARSAVLISFSKEVMWFVYLVCLLAG